MGPRPYDGACRIKGDVCCNRLNEGKRKICVGLQIPSLVAATSFELELAELSAKQSLQRHFFSDASVKLHTDIPKMLAHGLTATAAAALISELFPICLIVASLRQ